MKDKGLIVLIVVVLLITILLMIEKKKKEESGWWLFDKKTTPTPPSSMAGCTNCWVSSVEDGVEYCRWYDNYGRNTSTYAGRSCTGVQSNIGFNKPKRKPWWATLFGL